MTAEDYIISKLKAYLDTKSDRQLTDLKNVIGTQRPDLNLKYLRAWADRFNIREDLEKLL